MIEGDFSQTASDANNLLSTESTGVTQEHRPMEMVKISFSQQCLWKDDIFTCYILVVNRRTVEDHIPGWERKLSLLQRVRTVSATHADLHSGNKAGIFSGVKQPGSETDH
jgi:hypothetical protein